MRGTWQTTGSGGSGLGELVLVLAGVALLAGPVAAALGVLVHLLAVILAILAGLVIAGGAALVAWRVTHPARIAPWQNGSARAAQERLGANYTGGSMPGASQGRRIAPGASPQAVEQHVHFHVGSAEEAAELARRLRGG